LSADEDEDPFETYVVVRNERGDHSVWPTVKSVPAGWSALDFSGSRSECLDWIEAHWAGPSMVRQA
jgi:MbtH protein